MDVKTIQSEIQNSLININHILESIQSELNKLNTLSKPEGVLDKAVQEGLASSQLLTKIEGFSLQNTANS